MTLLCSNQTKLATLDIQSDINRQHCGQPFQFFDMAALSLTSLAYLQQNYNNIIEFK